MASARLAPVAAAPAAAPVPAVGRLAIALDSAVAGAGGDAPAAGAVAPAAPAPSPRPVRYDTRAVMSALLTVSGAMPPIEPAGIGSRYASMPALGRPWRPRRDSCCNPWRRTTSSPARRPHRAELTQPPTMPRTAETRPEDTWFPADSAQRVEPLRRGRANH